MATAAIAHFAPPPTFEPAHAELPSVDGRAFHVSSRVLGSGSYNVWREGSLDGKRIAVCEGGHRCVDPDILAMKRVYKQKHGQQAFAMEEEVNVGGRLVKIAPLLDGARTEYAGSDGFTVLCEALFSTNTPYHRDPAKNAIRLAALAPVRALLELHRCAREAEAYRFVHGDVKPEQFVIDTLEKAGVARPYPSLVLVDMPDKINPRQRTPFFCPAESGPQRFHYEDLFALKATFARLLYRVLTEPVFEADIPIPFDTSTVPLADWLVEKTQPRRLPKEALKAYHEAGYPITIDPKGNHYVYPDIFNPNTSHKILEQLEIMLDEMPEDSPYAKLADCLHQCILLLDGEMPTSQELRMDPLLAQEHLIQTLELLEDRIRTGYLPAAGPTGSPQKTLAPLAKKPHPVGVKEDGVCKSLWFGADDAAPSSIRHKPRPPKAVRSVTHNLFAPFKRDHSQVQSLTEQFCKLCILGE